MTNPTTKDGRHASASAAGGRRGEQCRSQVAGRRSQAGGRHEGARPRILMCHARSGGLRIEFPGGNRNAKAWPT